MKNLFKSMMLVAVAAMGLTACSNEAVEEVNPEVQTITRELIVSSEKPALEGDTRTEINGETVVWSTGDAIRMVYHSEKGWGAKFYASKSAVIEGNKATFAVDTEFSANDGGNYQFYAGYPTKQWNGGEATYSGGGTVTVKIPTEQTMPSANTFDSKGDLLIGKSVAAYAEIPASGESMNFNYTRLVSHACVTLKEFAAVEGEKVLNVAFTAPADVYLTGSSTADFEAQALTEDFDKNTVTVTLPENTAANADVVVWFCSAPATIAKDQTLTVTVETNLATYTRTITAREDGIQFLQNKYSTLGINMASAEFVAKEVDSNDYSGDYYILAKRSTGNFWYATSDLGSANTKRYQAVDTGNTDINSVVLTDATVWTIEATGEGTYYLKAGDRYASWTSGNSSNFTEEVNNAIKFTIEAGSEEGTYNIHWTASDSERYFALNETANNNYFAFYKDTQIINLYLVPATPDTRTQLATPSVTATANGKNVTVSWGEVANAGSYTLTYGNETIENATSPYEFEGAYSTTYNFSVVAVPTDTETYKNSAAGTAEITIEDDPNATKTTVEMDIYGTTGTTGTKTISWTEGNVTVTNNQASSSTTIRTSDSNHYRVYAKSEFIVSVASGTISQVVITCTSASYATAMKTSYTNAGYTVSVDGSVVTVTGSASSFTMTASEQIRLNKVAVTYTK